MTTVYSLSSTRNGEVRYIGQTTQPLNRRLVQHRNYAKLRRVTAVHKWMVREIEAGFEISIEPLIENAVLHETEMAVIAQYRSTGARLLNLTDGGEGTIGWHGNKGNKRPDLAEKNRQSKGKPGHPSTPETNAKISAAHKGRKRPYMSERNKAMAGLPGHPHTAESKAKISAGNKGKVVSAETRRKISEINTGRKRSSEGIAKLRAGYAKYIQERRA